MLKANFRCNNCSTDFEIKSDYLRTKEKVICPSCDIELSYNLVEDLREVVKAFDKFTADQRAEIKVKSNQGEKYIYAEILSQ